MKGIEVPKSREQLLNAPKVYAYPLKDDGLIPNNPKLPLLIYEGALNLTESAPAPSIEALLEGNSWAGSWRNGIYAYHHFHSTAHEILVVFGGAAKVQLGGESGIVATIKTGDAVIIPAGVAHKTWARAQTLPWSGPIRRARIGDWNICYGKAAERPKAEKQIAEVRFPEKDPMYGESGPLLKHWEGEPELSPESQMKS